MSVMICGSWDKYASDRSRFFRPFPISTDNDLRSIAIVVIGQLGRGVFKKIPLTLDQATRCLS